MNRGPAPRFLAALTAAVVAAHLLTLAAMPKLAPAAEPVRTGAFIARSIAEPVVEAPVLAPPQPAPPPPVRVKRRPAAAVPLQPGASAGSPVPAREQPAQVELVAQSAPAGVTPPSTPREKPAAATGGAKATPVRVPGPIHLRYKVNASVRGFSLHADGELQWQHDGADYDAKLEIRGSFFPTRTERSVGRITAQGVAPTRFSDRSRSEEAAHFQREKGLITFSSNRPDVPMQPGAQDRLSVMLQLGALIAGDPARYPAGTSITMQTASTRDAEPWVFTVEGEEELALPGGVIKGIKLNRNPRREFDQKVELWIAPQMDYVPVRVRLTNPNGDSVDQQWSSTDKG